MTLWRPAACALLLVVLVACSPTGGSPRPSADLGSDKARTSDDPPRSLIYLKGDALFRLDLQGGGKRKLAKLPSQDVFPHPEALAVVNDRGGGDDFAARPVLTVRDYGGAVVSRLGPGFSPLWSPDGRLAYLRPARARECEGEACAGDVEVMVVREGLERPERLLPGGRWGLLAWSGDRLIVADGRSPDRSLLVDEDGRGVPLPYAPTEVWDATDSQLIVARGGMRVVDLDTDQERRLAVDGTLAEGALSGSGLLAVELLGGRSRLVHASLSDGDVTPIDDSRGAMGPVSWGVDGEAFFYVRADRLELEAVVCRTARDCAPVLRWDEGITPLALR